LRTGNERCVNRVVFSAHSLNRFAATQINEGLDQIFVKLKKKNINPALLGASGNRTLYDFVDNASIERLQKQTTKEINQMKVRSHHNVPSH